MPRVTTVADESRYKHTQTCTRAHTRTHWLNGCAVFYSWWSNLLIPTLVAVVVTLLYRIITAPSE